MDRNDYEFTAKIDRETDLSYRVHDGERFHWLPKSQIKIEKGLDDMAEITVPEWLAKEKGLI